MQRELCEGNMGRREMGENVILKAGGKEQTRIQCEIH